MVTSYNIANLTHPLYNNLFRDWTKWRLAYEGGASFIVNYLEKLNNKESNADFNCRRNLTCSPSFAKIGILEIKNSIAQKLPDIQRIGGSDNYQLAMAGKIGGVDNKNNSMNYFLSEKILPELLVMGRTGIYVDMPVLNPTPLLTETINIHPYLYHYETESIRNWNSNYSSMVLCDLIYEYDPRTNLPIKEVERYRYIYINAEGFVTIEFYNKVGNPYPGSQSIVLNIREIPFIILELSNSLMCDIADYQIALLNLMSADISYILKSNKPFYTEQYDPRATAAMLRKIDEDDTTKNTDNKIDLSDGARQYPIGANAPEFINPSSEPVKISMEKQQQLKEEIRLLLNLAISNLKPTISSAEAKGLDERLLESGLSAVALTLFNAEQQIAKFWTAYEGVPNTIKINYPEKFDLQNDTSKIEKCNKLASLIPKVPSKTFRKEITKNISYILLNNRLPYKILEKIDREIDLSTTIDDDPTNITKDIENGLVDRETASKIRGYPLGSVEKAKEEYLERLELIAKSQQPGKGLSDSDNNNGNKDNNKDNGNKLTNPAARGVPDLTPTPNLDKQKEKAAVNKGDE